VKPHPVHNRQTLRHIARFRYSLRKFLRFSERAAREYGLTPQQHQLLLGVAGYTDRNCATISELAEFLQERHNSVVELVTRAAKHGLVRKEPGTHDRRQIFVSLTPRGEELLSALTTLHRRELQRLQTGLLAPERPTRRLNASTPQPGKKR